MSRKPKVLPCQHLLTVKLKTETDAYPVTLCLVCQEIRIHHPALGPQVLLLEASAAEVAGWNPVRTPLTPREQDESAEIEEYLARGETPPRWEASIAAAHSVGAGLIGSKPFPRQFDSDGPEA